MATVRFGNDTISGTGVRFDMNAYNLAFNWKNFIDFDARPGIPITSGLDVRLPATHYNGHDTPHVTIQGVIDASQADPTYDSGGNPLITVQWLGSLSLVGSGYLLYPAVTQFLGKQPVATGSISAFIEDIKLSPDVKSFSGGSEHILNYAMEFVLVSGPV